MRIYLTYEGIVSTTEFISWFKQITERKQLKVLFDLQFKDTIYHDRDIKAMGPWGFESMIRKQKELNADTQFAFLLI